MNRILRRVDRGDGDSRPKGASTLLRLRPILLGLALAPLAAVTPAAHADPAGQPAAAGRMEPGDSYRVYLTNEGSGDLTVIDGRSRSVVATWPLGKRPRGLAASADGRYLYVALSGSPLAGPGVDESSLPAADRAADGIAVIDASTGTIERVLRGATDPEQVALSRDGSRLYVASEDAGKAMVFDARSGRLLGSLDVGGEPEGVTVSPDGSLAFVTSEALSTVAVVETREFRTRVRVPVGQRPRDVLVSPDGKTAYVSSELGGSISVIDIATSTVKTVVKVPGEKALPKGLALSSDGRRLYVSTGRGGMVVAFDTRSLEPIGSVKVGARPWGIALEPGGGLLYTANGPSNDVSIVDTGTLQVIATLATGTRPWGVVVAPLPPGGQPSAAAAAPGVLRPVVVIATREPQEMASLPVSVTLVDRASIRTAQLQVNLSESLQADPGLSIQNRQNYAQSLQMSIRGFGARSSFGVRGVRLLSKSLVDETYILMF